MRVAATSEDDVHVCVWGGGGGTRPPPEQSSYGLLAVQHEPAPSWCVLAHTASYASAMHPSAVNTCDCVCVVLRTVGQQGQAEALEEATQPKCHQWQQQQQVLAGQLAEGEGEDGAQEGEGAEGLALQPWRQQHHQQQQAVAVAGEGNAPRSSPWVWMAQPAAAVRVTPVTKRTRE
jgi:hypothetical protein